jgi:porin
MRLWLSLFLVMGLSAGSASAQEDKKTDDLKPADPDTGESTVEETRLGLLLNPLQRWGVKFATTYTRPSRRRWLHGGDRSPRD